MPILSHRSFPRAILHIDGDSFFASCEVTKNPALCGKPVVTGKERGICSSMSYEARARGVRRAMRLSEIKRICPDVIILPSDYETYSLYSERMYEIVRRYTPDVEEYSIDECFADLTGMRQVNHMSYEDMAAAIKHDVEKELGMTFSIGLSVNKVMAKVASKWNKPSGLTIIRGKDIHLFLEKTRVEKIWGIGPNTSMHLNKLGIVTALDFAMKTTDWVKASFTKPMQEIHFELRGEFVYSLSIGTKHDYASISKTRTFTPPSIDKEYVFSQLSKNIENACIKLRRHHLFTKRIAFFLKTQSFNYYGLEIKLSHSVCIPEEIIRVVRQQFDHVYRKGSLYRATGITLMDLGHDDLQTADLFGQSVKIQSVNKIYDAIDRVDTRYGKHTVFLGSSFRAMTQPGHYGDRGDKSERSKKVLKGENARQRIGIPYLGVVK